MRGAKAIIVLLLLVIAIVFATTRLTEYRMSESWVEDATSADSALFSSSRVDTRGTSVHNGRPYSHTYAKREFKPKHIEINGADSVTLCSVYGIGPVFSSRIIARRTELGGYCNLEQLGEVRGITKEVYELVSKNFWIDSARIRKISVNFAPLNALISHPYCTPSMARRIEQGRMKGGFSNTRELIERDILLPKEARKIAPYLSFEK